MHSWSQSFSFSYLVYPTKALEIRLLYYFTCSWMGERFVLVFPERIRTLWNVNILFQGFAESIFLIIITIPLHSTEYYHIELKHPMQSKHAHLSLGDCCNYNGHILKTNEKMLVKRIYNQFTVMFQLYIHMLLQTMFRISVMNC